jgi:hypothetical protein
MEISFKVSTSKHHPRFTPHFIQAKDVTAIRRAIKSAEPTLFYEASRDGHYDVSTDGITKYAPWCYP